MKRLFAILVPACLVFTTAHARLGETLAQLKVRYRDPAPQAHRDPSSAVWFFEGEDGELVYNVTFNAKGLSIAEGLKPVKRARFPKETVQDFITLQLEPYRGSPTTRILNPGDKYTFAGRTMVCGEQEYVVVDDPNGVLIVWSRSGMPSVIAIRPEMLQGK
jgi:hypothetical protein